MNKRLFLALGLWLILIIVWNSLSPNKKKTPEKKDNTKVSQKTFDKKDAVKKGSAKNVNIFKTVKTKNDYKTSQYRAANVVTTNFIAGLNKIDGTLDSIKFVKYNEAGKNINFIEKNFKFLRNFRVSFYGLYEADKQSEMVFNHKKVSGLEHVFQKQIENGFFLNKRYKFYPDKNYFDLYIELINQTGKTKRLRRNNNAYSLIWGSTVNWKKDKKTKGMYDNLELIYYGDDGDLEEIDDNKTPVNAFRWVGMHDRYFLLAVIPVDKSGNFLSKKDISSASVNIDKKKNHKSFALNRAELTLDNRETRVDRYRIFIGPKKHALLTDDSVAQYNLDKIFTGFFIIKVIGILIEKLMYFVHAGFLNFGLVIILVTLIIKLALHPLTKKSTSSMKKMQLLQPKINAIKEQYKSDPKVMNAKMMALYKTEKINPMGGCLPLLLQMPIFFALYRVIPRMIDLKDAHFLWIKDLSMPDTIMKIDALKNVPLLPATINILPLIMTVGSWWHSKIAMASQSGGSDKQNQQNKMMMMMPLIFLFILWNMPSGLVLYWTVQTLVAIVQQVFVNKKFDTPAPVPAK